MRTLIGTVRRLFGRRRDAEMSAELAAHVDALTERNIAAGMTPDDARYAALREFGGVEQIKERCRDERRRGWVWIEQTVQDFRHALRALARHRGFTTVAVLTLALGIGVNAALFTVFDVMTLRPLPIKDARQLFDVRRLNDVGWKVPGFSYPEYLEVRRASQAFEGFGAWMDSIMTMDDREQRNTPFALRRSSDATAVPVQFVSDNFFALLGGEIVLGRGFLPEETARPGADPVIVLSHQFWTEQYDGDPKVLGTAVRLNDVAYTVVGVTASDFTGKQLAPPIGWIPLTMLDEKDGGQKILADRGNTRFLVFTRIRPGFDSATAYPELQVVVQRLAADATGPRRLTRAQLLPTSTFLPMPLNWKTAEILAPVWLSFLAVLLIAAANVANLLLARASIRQHEIGVRLALGATRARVIRHLLMESILISVAGGAAGLLVTTWLLRLVRPSIVSLLPPDPIARSWLFVNLTPDYRIVLVTFALVLLAAVAAGLMPAWLCARADVNESLKHGEAALTASSRPRRMLVIAQIAICLTLLAGAGVMVRHTIGYAMIETGVRTDHLYPAVFRELPSNFHSLPLNARQRAMQNANAPAARRDAVMRARGLPGVTGLAQARFVPFVDRLRYTAVRTALDAEQTELVHFNLVSPDFFALFALSTAGGRVFSAHDADMHRPFIVINQACAERFFPHQNPVGQHLEIADIAANGGWSLPQQAALEPASTYSLYEIVAVVHDTRVDRIWQSDGPVVYLPLASEDARQGSTIVRLSSSREQLAPVLRDSAAAAELSFDIIDPIDDARRLQLLPFTMTATIGLSLAIVAIALAMVGLYGVMAFMVNQRTREIGVRIALGATAERVVSLFVRQGFRLVLAGVALGAIGALLVPLTLPKAMVGPAAIEPLSLSAVVLLLLVAALTACWLPARRAARVDPVVALRTE